MRRIAPVLVICLFGLGVFPSPATASLALPPEAARSRSPVKVLTVVEENHSFAQMRSHMPYLFSLAKRFGYATHYHALAHPSLPNYLTLTGGSTFGVTDDAPPAVNAAKVGKARSVFDQALRAGKSAGLYAESMPSSCDLVDSGLYAVKHNPWAYFRTSRKRCERFDRPMTRFRTDARHDRLPNVGMVIPNECHDAHDCSLKAADRWLKSRLPAVLQSRDFTTGRLVVVVTADEDDYDSGNKVLTVVMQASLHGEVVKAALTHYSLLGYVDHVLGLPLLRKAQKGFGAAFEL